MAHKNLVQLAKISEALGPLSEKVVFVGGAVVPLYALPKRYDELRPTEDVDCIVKVATRGSFATIEEQLRGRGFVNDRRLICRFHHRELQLDIVPTDKNIIGFSNQWYAEGFQKQEKVKNFDGKELSILPVNYFLATKFEALSDRGGNDLRFSNDLEDVLVVLSSKEVKLEKEPEALKNFLSTELRKLKENTSLQELIGVHLGHHAAKYRDFAMKQILIDRGQGIQR